MNKTTTLINAWLASCALAFTADAQTQPKPTINTVLELRTVYSQSQNLWPKAHTTDNRAVQPLAPLTLLKPEPPAAHITLGQALFFDPQLSKDSTVSCASCHEPRLKFADKRRLAVGIDMQEGARNTPNIFGIDHWQSFFWDGRAVTAQQQALMPIEDPLEMNLSIDKALARINQSSRYQTMNKSAFGQTLMTQEHLAEALVAFQRMIRLPETKFSGFIKQVQSQPADAINTLTDSELNGLHLFRTKAKCMTCHQGSLLSDNQFHVTGLHYYGREYQDLGRYAHTQNPQDVGKFRTASLLLVSQTGPWMHNGLFDQLGGIVNFYNNGGARPRPRAHVADDPLFPKTTDLLQKLSLTQQEMTDLVAFLNML